MWIKFGKTSSDMDKVTEIKELNNCQKYFDLDWQSAGECSFMRT